MTPRRIVLAVALLLAFVPRAWAADPLPSWNDGNTRKAILSFVARVTAEGGRDYMAPADRIAVFDNDGTLWSEQPIYVQAAFVFDRIKALAPQHPEWKDKDPFASVLKDDVKSALAEGDRALLEWTTAGAGPHLALLVRRDDAVREAAYDRESAIGRLARGLDEAAAPLLFSAGPDDGTANH